MKTKETDEVETLQICSNENILRKIYSFIKENHILLIFTILCIFMAVGSQLFSTNMRVDVQMYMLNPDYDYNWLEIGRFGAIILKNILTLNFFTPYFISGMFFLFLILTMICYEFLIKKYAKKVDFLLVISVFLIFASPMFAEQFYFMMQSVENLCAMIFVILAVYNIFEYINLNKIRYAILAIILMTIAFGTYQSFAPMYICLVTAIYLLSSVNDKKTDIKDELKKFLFTALKLIITFVIAYILYILITKIVATSGYLTDNILWGKENILVILKNILGYMKLVIFGDSNFYSRSYLVMAILLVVSQSFVDWKKDIFIKLKNLIVVLVFLLTPFLLEIYVGQDSVIRSQLTLPVTVAIGFILVRILFI